MHAEIHVVDGIDTDGIEELLERVSKEIRREIPKVTQTFIALHPTGREGRS